MKYLIVAVSALVVFSAVFISGSLTARAEDSNHTFNITHGVNISDSGVEIEQRVRVNSSGSLESLEVALPVESASDIEAEYSDGSTIPFSTVKKQSAVGNVEFEHTALVLDFPRERDGQWDFVVSFTSDEGISGFGDSRIVLLPFLDGRLGADWIANVSVPGDWPLLNYRPTLRSADVASDVRRFQVHGDDYRHPVLALSFSTATKHEAKGVHTLRNDSFLPRTMRVPLPLDTHSQSVSIESIEPRPSRMSLDRDGNVLAHYYMWPWQTKTVEYEAVVAVEQLRYDGSGSEGLEEIADEFAHFTLNEGHWATSEAIENYASEHMDSDDVYGSILNISESIFEHLEYIGDDVPRSSASEVLDSGEADAQGFADVLTAALRSQDIPARVVHGSVYPSAALHDERHIWVEAYAPGVGWVNLDPLWARFFGSSGSSGVDRVAWLVESDDGYASLLAGLESSIALDPVESDIEEDEDVAPAEEALRLNNTAYMVLPGLSVWSRSIENTGGTTLDNISFDGGSAGSLAPMQAVEKRTWQVGFSLDNVSATMDEEEMDREVVMRWWPMIGVGVILLALCVLQFYRWRRRYYIRKRLGHTGS